jgi:hypothetical protein
MAPIFTGSKFGFVIQPSEEKIIYTGGILNTSGSYSTPYGTIESLFTGGSYGLNGPNSSGNNQTWITRYTFPTPISLVNATIGFRDREGELGGGRLSINNGAYSTSGLTRTGFGFWEFENFTGDFTQWTAQVTTWTRSYYIAEIQIDGIRLLNSD